MRHQQLDATLLESVPQRVRVVSTVGNYPFRFLPRATSSPARDANRCHRRFGERDFRRGSTRQLRSQRNALAIDQYHPLCPLPALGFPTAAPLFWPIRSCHRERFRPTPAVAGDAARPATATTPPAKHPGLPTAADAASRSPRWDTRPAGRANEPRCATPRECLPRTAGSMPTVGPVRRAAASARGTNAQATPTAVHSASCQQLSPMLLCRISACLEAEPIYETRSMTRRG